jgi:hypothetical protein
MRVVKVEWIDSCTSDINWVLLEDINEVEPINITTYGTVIKETDEYIVIAQNYGSNPEQVCNITSIPKGCIKNIIELK